MYIYIHGFENVIPVGTEMNLRNIMLRELRHKRPYIVRFHLYGNIQQRHIYLDRMDENGE